MQTDDISFRKPGRGPIKWRKGLMQQAAVKDAYRASYGLVDGSCQKHRCYRSQAAIVPRPLRP